MTNTRMVDELPGTPVPKPAIAARTEAVARANRVAQQADHAAIGRNALGICRRVST
jgi:hypothetical protein